LPLAGFQSQAGEEVSPQLATDQQLALAREPDSPFDADVARIDWHEHRRGYLPCAENTAVAQLLDRGESLSARINALRQAADPWQRVGIEVLLDA
jgi:hypothetical protein